MTCYTFTDMKNYEYTERERARKERSLARRKARITKRWGRV